MMLVELDGQVRVERLEAGDQIVDVVMVLPLAVEHLQDCRVREALEDFEAASEGYVDAADASVGCVHGGDECDVRGKCESLRELEIDRFRSVLQQEHQFTESPRDISTIQLVNDQRVGE